jgi:hypothetical protein
MAEFLDFDPETGVAHYFDYDHETDLSRITTVQDIEPLLEYNQRLRNERATDGGIKAGWWLYAKIPAVVQLKMRAKGIDINDPGSTKRIIQEINEHYPQLKTTVKNDSGIRPKLFMPAASDAE